MASRWHGFPAVWLQNLLRLRMRHVLRWRRSNEGFRSYFFSISRAAE